MKAGVTMRRRSHMEISSMIVFLSIISILVQFTAYYFFASPYLILGISSVIVIICTHILLEQSMTYESCTVYTILLLFISIIITLLTYLGTETNMLPFTNTLYGIIALNWSLPMLHCFIRNMFDYGSRIEKFNSFYRNVSIIFILFYIGILLYLSFTENSLPSLHRMRSNHQNFTPFWWVATQIEDYINEMIPLSDILTYLLSRILAYVPYGFYGILLLRNRSKLVRLLFLFLLPSVIELFQYFIIPARCDIDDVIYAFIGGSIGGLWFHLTNTVYRAVSGKNFLSKDSDYRYSNSTLHF
ncbi:MAG: VanZ family protein [Anaerolineaceae bacterium]|nr:MAG: VanZ family protein [Anaerolineaceae bacterium]